MDATMHFQSRASAETALMNRGADEDQVFSLLTLAETYGSVHIPRFEVVDDDWGKHYSLTVQNSREFEGWMLIFTTHLDY